MNCENYYLNESDLDYNKHKIVQNGFIQSNGNSNRNNNNYPTSATNMTTTTATSMMNGTETNMAMNGLKHRFDPKEIEVS